MPTNRQEDAPKRDNFERNNDPLKPPKSPKKSPKKLPKKKSKSKVPKLGWKVSLNVSYPNQNYTSMAIHHPLLAVVLSRHLSAFFAVIS